MAQPMTDGDLSAVLSAWVTTSDIGLSVARPHVDGPFLYVNPAFVAASGYSAAQLVGTDVRSLDAPDTDPATQHALTEAVRTGRPARARIRKQRPDGTIWWSQLHLCPIRDSAGSVTHLVGLALDITDQVLTEEQTAHTAAHDGLTGLVTRAHFLDSLTRELARAARDRTSVGVLFLDVDHLKTTNDTHGHPAGDALLTAVATRLQRRLRGGDLAGRYGGDEFVVLLTGLPAEPATAAAAATGVLDELTATLHGTIDISDLPDIPDLPGVVDTAGTVLALSVSIGLALSPGDGATAAELIAAADTAMYHHKRHR